MPNAHVGTRRSGAQRLAFLTACVLAMLPGNLRAQETPPTSASASLEASLRITRMRSETSFLAGATGLLSIDPRFSFGGAGWVLLEEPTVDTGTPGSGFKLRMAYGGLVTAARLMETTRARVAVRTLWGAGNAKIVLPVSETEIDADNFGVVEPELSGTWHLNRLFDVGVGLAYRFVFGVEDLTGVSATHLRGPSASLSVSARGF